MALTPDQELALAIIEAEETIVREAWISILNAHPVVPELEANAQAAVILGT